ncbi:MAG: hypothetical protein ABIP48_04500, partial [Planctomycetota bacterium]
MPPLQPQSVECEGYIDRRLRQTRRQVKRVDLWAGLIALAAAALAYLLLATVADHWLIRGGLDFWGRLVLFAGLLGAASFILALRIAPPLIHRVNPIFAAHSIEQTRPSLKNSLVNLLYLRRERNEAEQDALSRGVYQALERKAAADLTEIPGDIAVDRSHLVRLGSVLAAVLAVSCLYLALSPKSTMASLRRVIWPWADIKAPTRVKIEGIMPGDGVAYQGDVVSVSAEVNDLADGEEVLLYYTTADGQSVDQAIPMTRPEDRSRHGCDLPPGRFGLQQNVEYYLAAGDCRTPQFTLKVETAPSIVVDRVEYDYPEYTGIPDRIDRRLADLKAIEGTRVMLHATANQQINRAAVEFDGDPRHALKMTIEESRKATARFTLAMDPDNPGRPERKSYELRFTDTSGRGSRRPIRHRIEVIRDLAPEISFIEPPPEEIELAEDGALELRIRAEDPDFALRRVALRAERDEESLPIPPLCDKPRPEPPHEGPFEKTYLFEPARLGLKAGDRVIYWAEAEDNMFWEEPANTASAALGSDTVRPPNRLETARRWITITRPEDRRPPAEPPQEPGTPPSQTPKQEPEQPPAEPAAEPGQPEQPKEEPGQDQPQDAPEDPPSGDSQEPQQGESDQQQTGEQNADQQSDTSKGGSESQQPGENSGQKGSEQQGADPQTGNQTGGQPSPRREPIDGETNAGDAFEEILKHRAEQQQNQEASGQAGKSGEQPGQEADKPGADGASQGAERGKPSGEEPSADAQREPGAGEQAEEQKMPDNRPANGQNAGPNQQPEDAQGAQAKGPGEPDQKESSTPGQEKPDAQGGDPNDSEGQTGAGRPSSENAGSPAPQEANQQRQKQSSEGDQGEPSEGESAQSPSTSLLDKKDSNSQGDTSGDRSGGGEKGGGQRSKQTGTGAAGTQNAAEQGGSPSDQQGEGEAGTNAGDQMKADQPTGQAAKEGEGPGSSQQKQPGGEQPGETPEKPRDQQDGPPSGKPSG